MNRLFHSISKASKNGRDRGLDQVEGKSKLDPRAARTHNLQSRNLAPYHLASGPLYVLRLAFPKRCLCRLRFHWQWGCI